MAAPVAGLKTARKQHFIDELTAAGVPTKGLKTRVDMITGRDGWIPPAPPSVSKFDEDDPIVEWSWKAADDRLWRDLRA